MLRYSHNLCVAASAIPPPPPKKNYFPTKPYHEDQSEQQVYPWRESMRQLRDDHLGGRLLHLHAHKARALVNKRTHRLSHVELPDAGQ